MKEEKEEEQEEEEKKEGREREKREEKREMLSSHFTLHTIFFSNSTTTTVCSLSILKCHASVPECETEVDGLNF